MCAWIYQNEIGDTYCTNDKCDRCTYYTDEDDCDDCEDKELI